MTFPRWLHWPGVWYATPTFGVLIAVQAPYWKYTDRVFFAVGVWLAMGLIVDIWMTKRNFQLHREPSRISVKGAFFWGGIVSVTVGVGASVLQPWAQGPTGRAMWAPLVPILKGLGILLPRLDFFYDTLLQTGRSSYFAFAGGTYVLLVVVLLANFLLLYRALVSKSQTEFAKGVTANRYYGSPPYGPGQRQLASTGLKFASFLGLFCIAIFFGNDIHIADSPRYPPISETFISGGRGIGYTHVSGASIFINFCLMLFHSCRQFLSTLMCDGALNIGRDDNE